MSGTIIFAAAVIVYFKHGVIHLESASGLLPVFYFAFEESQFHLEICTLHV